jgi:hypothetical protein
MLTVDISKLSNNMINESPKLPDDQGNEAHEKPENSTFSEEIKQQHTLIDAYLKEIETKAFAVLRYFNPNSENSMNCFEIYSLEDFYAEKVKVGSSVIEEEKEGNFNLIYPIIYCMLPNYPI